jgi:DNA-binding IclR family transcriptional regulator
MTQAETTQVRVLIEANGLRYEAHGPVEQIIPQILQFLSQSVPAFDLAKKVIYVSDLAGLADRISEFAKMTHTGQLLLTRKDISADRAISILLFMAHLAAKMGKRGSESLSIEEIANGVGKSPKTIRNVIVELQKDGLIEREERGSYKITTKGLMELETRTFIGSSKGGAAD